MERPMAFEHTAKAFDSDLQELTRLVAEMGGPHCDLRDIDQSSQKSQL